jgi:hypothetical protein
MMIRFLLVISLITISLAITADAQTAGTKTRYNLESTRFQKQHMPQTVVMLINALKDSNPSKRSTAAQNIRDLEFAYPDEPFSDLLTPLMDRLKDEKEVFQVRILSALALDGLHNDTGDQVIGDISKTTSNQSLKELCIALLVKAQR